MNFNISNVAVEMKLNACEYFLVTEHRSKHTNTATLEYKNSKDIIFHTITYTRLCKLFANDKQVLEVGWYLFNRLSPQLNG